MVSGMRRTDAKGVRACQAPRQRRCCRTAMEALDEEPAGGSRRFKQSAGVTPHHYLTQKRLQRAQEMLVQTNLPLSEIAYAAGFFRPEPSGASLPSHARHGPARVPVVATPALLGSRLRRRVAHDAV